MTTSVRIVNTSNCEGDELIVRTVNERGAGFKEIPPTRLQRGEVSGPLGCGTGPFALHLEIEGTHAPDHPYLGEVDITTHMREAEPAKDASGHDIGWAMEQVKAGHRVCRPGWNGKGMYLYLMPSFVLEAVSRARLYEPCITMHTAQGKEQPGWLASQPDLLATDWELLAEPTREDTP